MSRGFSLVEALFATTVLTVALVAVAQLAVLSTRANQRAGSATFMAVLAAQKMEQLRALAWTFDASGSPLSDMSTDTASEGTPGGTGLTPSPSGVLEHNTSGYCDFLDQHGQTLGGGAVPPDRSAFVRRWSIDPIEGLPNDTLLIQVLVIHPGGGGEEARIVGVRTRKGG